MTDEPRRDDLAAYALGALEPEAITELEEHLAGCERCREYLHWLQPAVELLPTSVEQVRAPRAVRKAVMAEVRADAARRHPRNAWRDRRLFGFAMRPALAGAAAVAVIAAGVAGYLLRGSGSGEHVSVVAAQPTAAAKPGTVSASLERGEGAATLIVRHLPKLSSRSVYEVWLQRGETMEPQSTFVLSRDGSANAAVPGPLNGASAVLVTKEPRGGSEAPTSAPLLRAPLD
jgi:anti-sigma-K factor RskA